MNLAEMYRQMRKTIKEGNSPNTGCSWTNGYIIGKFEASWDLMRLVFDKWTFTADDDEDWSAGCTECQAPFTKDNEPDICSVDGHARQSWEPVRILFCCSDCRDAYVIRKLTALDTMANDDRQETVMSFAGELERTGGE